MAITLLLHCLSLLCLIQVPTTAVGQLSSPCTLCPIEGDSITKPEKLVEIAGYYQLNCATLDNLVPALFETEANCNIVQSISPLCGCQTTQPDPCVLCSNGTSVANPKTIVPGFASSVLNLEDQDCELVEAFLLSQSAQDEVCIYGKQSASPVCGCPVDIPEAVKNSSTWGSNSSWGDGSPSSISLPRLWGAKSESDRQLLKDLHKSSSVMSLIGATLVLCDSLYMFRRNQMRQASQHLYNQIMFTMSLYDLTTAVIFTLGSLVIPADHPIGGLNGAGNEATCTASGFFKTLGLLTSIFLNGALATYYFLVIVKTAPESRLRALRKWLIGIPVICGLILACAAIPFISPTLSGCGVAPPQSNQLSSGALEEYGLQSSWGPYLGIILLPAMVLLAYATGTVLRIYSHVVKQRSKSNRHSLRRRGAMSGRGSMESFRSNRSFRSLRRLRRMSDLTREVSWQCCFYLLAVNTTWLTYLISVSVVDSQLIFKNYELWCALHFLIPLQPFLNCLVYFRPRAVRKFRALRGKYHTWREDRQRKQMQHQNEMEEQSSTHQYSTQHPSTEGSRQSSRAHRHAIERFEELDNDYWPENSLAEMNSAKEHRQRSSLQRRNEMKQHSYGQPSTEQPSTEKCRSSVISRPIVEVDVESKESSGESDVERPEEQEDEEEI